MGVVDQIKRFGRAIARAVMDLFSNSNMLKEFGIEKPPQLDMNEYTKWANIARGQAPWNRVGETERKASDECNYPSTKMASTITRLLTKKVFVEFEADINGGKNAKPNLDRNGALIYNKAQRYTRLENDFSSYINKQLQYFLKTQIMDADVTVNNLSRALIYCANAPGENIVTFFDPTEYAPLARDSAGNLTEVLMAHVSGDYRLYVHAKYYANERRYVVQNRVYKITPGGTQTKARFEDVDQWRDLQEYYEYENISEPWFHEVIGYNGLPVWYEAAENIKYADMLYGLYLREATAGAMVIRAGIGYFEVESIPTGTTMPNGTPMFERVYRLGNAFERNILMPNGTPISSGDVDTYTFEQKGVPLREDHYRSFMNQNARMIESIIGITHGELSDVNLAARTATEIKSSKENTLDIVANRQATWKDALSWLSRALAEIAVVYSEYAQSDYELSMTWGDGVKEAWEDVFKRRTALVQNGWLAPQILVAEELGTTQDEALYAMHPKIPVDLTGDSGTGGGIGASNMNMLGL